MTDGNGQMTGNGQRMMDDPGVIRRQTEEGRAHAAD
jgi:hypothetical protein